MVEAARQGDQLAVDAIQRASRYLGRAIAAFVNIFNPSMVIIEGRMIELGDLFFDPIRREVQRHAFSLSRTVEILPGLLGYRAAAIGAATLVVDRFFTLANPLSQN
jgi:predicted NBD/HSP70 family sugar kinase